MANVKHSLKSKSKHLRKQITDENKIIRSVLKKQKSVQVSIVVVDRTENKYVQIPITKKELGGMFDLQFMMHDGFEIARQNKIEKDILSFFNKLNHAYNDCFSNGSTYKYDKEQQKWIETPKSFWMVGVPEWKKL